MTQAGPSVAASEVSPSPSPLRSLDSREDSAHRDFTEFSGYRQEVGAPMPLPSNAPLIGAGNGRGAQEAVGWEGKLEELSHRLGWARWVRWPLPDPISCVQG